MTDGGADSGLRSEDGVVQCTYVANREAKKWTTTAFKTITQMPIGIRVAVVHMSDMCFTTGVNAD